MKLQLENINQDVGSSFQMMYNPRLSDLFYWHFHPELELVYIKNATGTRHVGNHISSYSDSDLVLIGSHIPHLNFDYGVKSDYSKVVVHIKKEFVTNQIQNTPELNSIYQLFEKAKHGIAFPDAVKDDLGEELFQLQHLTHFDQYLLLMRILQNLSSVEDIELLHSSPYISRHSPREQERMRNIYSFIDHNYHRKIELQEVASLSNMTREAFCRFFKLSTGNTFVSFLNRYRISHAKRILLTGESVSTACYASGFENLSYFNRTFKKITGENPSGFRKRIS